MHFKSICVLIVFAQPLLASVWDFYHPFPGHLSMPHFQPFKNQPQPQTEKRDRIVEGDRHYHIIVKPVSDSSRFIVEFTSDRDLHIKEVISDWDSMFNEFGFLLRPHHLGRRSHPVAYEETFQLSREQVDISSVSAKMFKNHLVVSVPKRVETPAISRESSSRSSQPSQSQTQQHPHPHADQTVPRTQQKLHPQRQQPVQNQCQQARRQQHHHQQPQPVFTSVFSDQSTNNLQTPEQPEQTSSTSSKAHYRPQVSRTSAPRSLDTNDIHALDLDEQILVGEEISIEENHSKSRFASRGYQNPYTGEFQKY